MADRRCWDAVCFIGWLAEEEDKVEKCRAVLEQAEAGHLEILTSTLAIAEVLHLGGGYPDLPKSARTKIKGFLNRSFVIPIDVTRRVAERAQEVVWDHGVTPKDAIHVASALEARVPILHTFDGPLIRLSGSVGGDPELLIAEPPFDGTGQADLWEQ